MFCYYKVYKESNGGYINCFAEKRCEIFKGEKINLSWMQQTHVYMLLKKYYIEVTGERKHSKKRNCIC